MNLSRLVQRLAQNDGIGQIVGPHGSGKSTLICQLLPLLTAKFQCHVSRLTSAKRRLIDDTNRSFRATAKDGRRKLWIIDGFEQLPRWRQWWLFFRARRRGTGLLVTCHRDCGLPTIYATVSDIATTRYCVDWLLKSAEESAAFAVTDTELVALMTIHRNNVRELLFDLYDRFSSHPQEMVAK